MPKIHRGQLPRAFTTIELLTAIGILVVLVGIVFMGYRSVIGGSKLRATHVALENCRSLMAEREAVSGLGAGPSDWMWWQGGPVVGAVKYWSQPDPSGAAVPLDAPGAVKNESQGRAARNASRAVLNTSCVMGFLAAVPANRTVLGKIPADQVLTLEWIAPLEGPIPGPGPDGVLNTQDDVAEPVYYVKGSRVKYGGLTLICTKNHVAAAPPNPPATFDPTVEWNKDTVPVPLLSDGWRNPIIFVPATGLNVLLLKDHKDYVDPSTGKAYLNQPQTIRSPDNRPFFASAGPDGDFSKGDDNVYSFEK